MKSFKRTSYSIVDGDTIKLNRSIGGHNYVRLANIDTPEKRERGFQTAKNQLRGLLSGNPITVTPHAVNQNRIIGTVRVHGKNVNNRMKRRGY